jgi:hypothetical protein
VREWSERERERREGGGVGQSVTAAWKRAGAPTEAAAALLRRSGKTVRCRNRQRRKSAVKRYKWALASN